MRETVWKREARILSRRWFDSEGVIWKVVEGESSAGSSGESSQKGSERGSETGRVATRRVGEERERWRRRRHDGRNECKRRRRSGSAVVKHAGGRYI